MLEMMNCEREFSRAGHAFARLPYCQLRPGFVVSNEIQDE